MMARIRLPFFMLPPPSGFPYPVSAASLRVPGRTFDHLGVPRPTQAGASQRVVAILSSGSRLVARGETRATASMSSHTIRNGSCVALKRRDQAADGGLVRPRDGKLCSPMGLASAEPLEALKEHA
jgi:hypothetical protein